MVINMSAQDRTEEILRQMHILLAGSESYDGIGSKIILDKKRMLELLAELNKAIYAMMDEYELTTQGKDRARREAAKIGEDILKDASGKAEDVYAASVMYTNEALRHVQEIMQRATDAMQEIYKDANEKLQKEKDIVRRDQSDLKGHLQNLADTDKYLNLIEDRNREIEKERAKERVRWSHPLILRSNRRSESIRSILKKRELCRKMNRWKKFRKIPERKVLRKRK